MPERCEECDRLWAEHKQVVQKSFRWQERLRRAEIRQDHELVNAVAAQLTILMSEQDRTSDAFVQHQARAHSGGSEPKA
jgi:hypothetical protein